MIRRNFIKKTGLGVVSLCAGTSALLTSSPLFLFTGCKKNGSVVEKRRIPVIYSTDLFHPPEDPDDHYDLAMLFGLKEIEVKALIFDLATSHRSANEVGKVALDQISKITRELPPPWKIGLRNPLRSPDDQALDQPEEFQGGVELILSTLTQSKEKVVMFLVGSCRDFAVAYNRNPDLLRQKVKAIYVNAGNGPKGMQTEWNVNLDRNAYIGLMTSGLPIYWCPCFTNFNLRLPTPSEVTAGKAFCTYFIVPNQAGLLASAQPMVKNYFTYALSRSVEEPLGFLDKEVQALPESNRNMWCTGPFLHAAGKKIYQTGARRWRSYTPEKAKELGIEDPVVEVFCFEPVHITSVWQDVNGSLIPEFVNDTNTGPASIQVFRYTHPDFNAIMPSVLAGILETL